MAALISNEAAEQTSCGAGRTDLQKSSLETTRGGRPSARAAYQHESASSRQNRWNINGVRCFELYREICHLSDRYLSV
jgi:hypothetical protein